MEIVNTVTQLITNVGFPIACCVVLFYSSAQERKAHKEETQKFTEALDRNTIALEKILTKLGE